MAADEESSDDSDYSYGEVVKVADQKLSVLEYDYEMDGEKTVDYSVTKDTALTNIDKISELAKGDTVEVYFKDAADGSKVALTVIKDTNTNPNDGNQTADP